jgi:hypothetical protein
MLKRVLRIRLNFMQLRKSNLSPGKTGSCALGRAFTGNVSLPVDGAGQIGVFIKRGKRGVNCGKLARQADHVNFGNQPC